jgi:hypothetical protein
VGGDAAESVDASFMTGAEFIAEERRMKHVTVKIRLRLIDQMNRECVETGYSREEIIDIALEKLLAAGCPKNPYQTAKTRLRRALRDWRALWSFEDLARSVGSDLSTLYKILRIIDGKEEDPTIGTRLNSTTKDLMELVYWLLDEEQ